MEVPDTDENIQNVKEGGDWEVIWTQKNISNLIIFLRKIGTLFLELTKLLSRYIDEYIKNDKNYSIIELGCGGSSYLPYIQKKYKNIKIFGIDRSISGCKYTYNVLNESFFSGDIICGDIFKYPFSKKFDIVFSVGLIEHFDDTKSILEKHVEILKPGGLLICIVPNFMGFQGKFFNLDVWRRSTNPKAFSKGMIWGIKPISIKDLKIFLKDLNLENIKVHPIGGLFSLILMESYKGENNSFSLKLVRFFYRTFIFIPSIVISMITLFRLNTLSLSPFLIAVGIKKEKKQ